MEDKIALYMKNLGISRDEAIQLIADDEANVSVELSKSQVEAVKEMTRTTGDKDKRKSTRKPNENKRALITAFETFLVEMQCDPIVTNPEREIEFDFMGSHFRLTLAKPRAK